MSGEGPDYLDAVAGDGRGLRVSDDCLRGYGEGRGDDGVSPLGFLDDTQLPGLPDRHRKAAGEAAPEDPEARLRDGDAVLPALLKNGAHEAMAKQVELLRLSIDPDEYEDRETWLGVCRIVNAAASSVLSMQMKADEASLRSKQFDRLADLLQIVADEERLRPLVTLEQSAESPT